MHSIEYRKIFSENLPSRKLVIGLALSAFLLSGCTDTTAYHEVTVGKHQTIDDIGNKECGPSFLGISIVARRNRLREFNDLATENLHQGQKLKVPDSLCYDTGDKVREES
jgi:hypothetical protein